MHLLKPLLSLLGLVLQLFFLLERIVDLVLELAELGLLLQDGPIFLLEICLELCDLLLKLRQLVLVVVASELLAASLRVGVAHKGIVGLRPRHLESVLSR